MVLMGASLGSGNRHAVEFGGNSMRPRDAGTRCSMRRARLVLSAAHARSMMNTIRMRNANTLNPRVKRNHASIDVPCSIQRMFRCGSVYIHHIKGDVNITKWSQIAGRKGRRGEADSNDPPGNAQNQGNASPSIFSSEVPR